MSGPSPSPEIDAEALGLAHVATAAFVGARVAPSAQFWLSLPGGVALARSAQRRGLGRGYGASLAATLQGVAILGPLRVNGPLTQAISAPAMGRLEARGAPAAVQFAVCLALRLAHYAVLNVLAVWLLLGGIDGYVRTYEATTGWLGVLPQGRAGALVVGIAWQLAWAAFFSVVQVAVYRRALRRWPEAGARAPGAARPDPAPAGGHDARLLAVAALIAFAVLLASTAPAVLAAVAAWLALAWLLARPDPQVTRVGLALAVLLAIGTLAAGLIGALGLAVTARRAARAALLVLVATWLRGAAGPEGMRDVFRALLTRLRRLGWAREARALLEGLDSAPRLMAAGRELIEALRPVPKRPGPVADATTGWVAAEAARGAGGAPPAPARLAVRRRDRIVVVLAAVPVAGLLGHAL
ncbi:MAG TPA: hypothetical protein VGJ32_03515 [Solirubrobacteraceae bacterium]